MKDEAKAVRAVLHGVWDPIGCGVPEDEYDSYLWPVLDMLKRRADVGEVREYLREVADEGLLSPVPEERLEKTLELLMAINVAPA